VRSSISVHGRMNEKLAISFETCLEKLGARFEVCAAGMILAAAAIAVGNAEKAVQESMDEQSD
jgi:hypothetical protein